MGKKLNLYYHHLLVLFGKVNGSLDSVDLFSQMLVCTYMHPLVN